MMMEATCLILMILLDSQKQKTILRMKKLKVADTTSGSQNHEDMEEEDKSNNQDCTDASGASSEHFTSADLTAGYNSIFNPTVSNSSSELSLSPGMRGTSDVRRMLPNRTKHRRRTKDPPKL